MKPLIKKIVKPYQIIWLVSLINFGMFAILGYYRSTIVLYIIVIEV